MLGPSRPTAPALLEIMCSVRSWRVTCSGSLRAAIRHRAVALPADSRDQTVRTAKLSQVIWSTHPSMASIQGWVRDTSGTFMLLGLPGFKVLSLDVPSSRPVFP